MAVRSEGQFIGEMALFAVAAVRCASVRAKGPVRVKIVPGENLEELIDMAPEVWLAAAHGTIILALQLVSHAFPTTSSQCRNAFSLSSGVQNTSAGMTFLN